jgi:cyclopropane fatty-acyl-phospholipid synthase-like methyltransferase
MSHIPDKNTFVNAYADKAPWDIPKPQPAFVEAADQITGSVLDAGCGTGENALFIAQRGQQVTGIDFLEVPIKRAKQKAAERGLSVNFLVMDALALKELPQVFDNVIDCGLFHVFSDADRRKYVEGLATVLKPEGRLFVLCFSDEEPGTAGPRRVAKSELQAAFADGWAIESITPTRFEASPDFKQMFSEGGPKAWFVVVRRT